MPKVSQLPQDSVPVPTDYVVGNQASGPSTQRFKFSDLINLFWNLANVPSGATSPITRDNDAQFAYIASGLVWTGDAYASTRNASMTVGIVYINGRRISISAVTARTFTASVDTYIDILDNGDGTGTLVYTTVTNNAASPALAANSIRIGIIVTGATNIAAAGSINQGQASIALPIISSIPLSVTDSLGNLIYPRDPQRRVLGRGYRTTNAGPIVSTTGIDIQVQARIIAPAGRRIRLTAKVLQATSNTAPKYVGLQIWDGAVGSGTKIDSWVQIISTSGQGSGMICVVVVDPPSMTGNTSKTYNLGLLSDADGAAQATIIAATNGPITLVAEIE